MNNEPELSDKGSDSPLDDLEGSMTDLDIDIQVDDDRWNKTFPNLSGLISRAVGAALAAFKLPFSGPIEVSVQCVDDAFIHQLNSSYRGKNKPTNVLSFPGLDWVKPAISLSTPIFKGQEALLGEVVLSFDTLVKEADEQNKTAVDHVTHLIIHSVLHLLGFDHIEAADADQMEQIEIRIMEKLGLSNPYEVSDLTVGSTTRKAG